ncbi:MDM35 [Brettanomyces bruxellensis]|uniref:DEBR0S1_26500g1_1 n=1 Tax=Dekkera bruxellensis TaxID=5007 RepID=A0A7D9GYA3_DEKBR|nr:MDM35 [Brettanomyces bruxellensis]
MGNIMSTSFAPECTELKHKYDSCFNSWYSEKFLKGKGLHNECEDFWQDYKKCIEVHMKKQGIEHLLDDARKEAPFENGGTPKGKPTQLSAKDSKAR